MRDFEAALSEMQLFLGPNVQAFEREFADYCQATHGVGVSSGTDALVCALRACGVGPGDEVIGPSLTFFATVEAVLHVGAVPVLADVDEAHLSLDPACVREALSDETRAIVPVHLYGLPADMDPLQEIAREHGLLVIEDAAQAHGARYHGRRCGGLGDAASFSFYFTKNLGAVGEAGFVATSNDAVARELRLLRDHGHVTKYEHERIGSNYRLDELQAIVLRAKLPGLEAANARRRAIAKRYRQGLDLKGVRHLADREGCDSAHHVYPIRTADRDGLREHLEASGIGTGIHYRMGSHAQRALKDHPHRVAGQLGVTEAACRELLSIPVYPELSDPQVDTVIEAVRAFF